MTAWSFIAAFLITQGVASSALALVGLTRAYHRSRPTERDPQSW